MANRHFSQLFSRQYSNLGCFLLLAVISGSYSLRCENGDKNEVGGCDCFPCWTGDRCDKPGNGPPVFQEKIAQIDAKSEKVIYIAMAEDPESTTNCKDNEPCPCSEIEHGIEAGNDDGKFTIDKTIGIIKLTDNEEIGNKRYELTITAKKKFGHPDVARMKLIVNGNSDWTNRYKADAQYGYKDGAYYMEESHHREKRAATDTPSNVTFELTKEAPYDSITEIRVGQRVSFKLTISFPAQMTDMLVELFAPENDTIVMMLCDVKVASVGSNLAYTGSTDVRLESKNNSLFYDWAIIDFGNVTNDNSQAAQHSIIITYDAVMIQNDATTNDATYWVSAGAEYNDENEVWVGQASFTAKTLDNWNTTANTPTFNFSGPTEMEVGSSAIFTVDMYVTNPSIALSFDAFAPLNNTDAMSICGIQIKEVGENYMCGFDYTKVPSSLHAESGQTYGNSRGHLEIGVATNKGVRDTNDPKENSLMRVQFVVKVNENAVPSTGNWIGAALEMGSNSIWCGQISVNIVARTPSSLPLPTFSHTFESGSNKISTKIATLIELVLVMPLGTTELKIDAKSEQIGSFAAMQICSLVPISSGENLPCLDKDKQPTFSSVGDDKTVNDVAELDVGVITNVGDWGYLNMSLNDTKNTVKFKIALTATTKAVDGATYKLEIGITMGGSRVKLTDIDLVTDLSANLTDITETPGMTLNYKYSDGNVRIGEAVTVLYEITTIRNKPFSMFDMEFIAPNSSNAPMVSICRAELISVGKNLPCMSKSSINNQWSYVSQFNVTQKDRAVLSLNSVCNMEISDNATEDKFLLAGVFKVEQHPDASAGTSMYLSAGSMYTSTKMWVGQLTLTVDGSALPAPTAPDNPQFFLEQVDGLDSGAPPGYPVKFELTIKTVPGKTVDFTITIETAGTVLSMCSARLKEFGRNVPCADKTIKAVFTKDTNTGLNNRAVLSLGYVSNVGDVDDRTGTNNSTFDDNTLLVEFYVQSTSSTPAGNHPFTVQPAAAQPVINKDVVVVSPGPTLNMNVTNTTSINFVAAAIVSGDDSYNVSRGQAKRFFIDVGIPIGEVQKVTVKLMTAVDTFGQFEVIYIGLSEAGENLGCLTREMTTSDYTSRYGTYTDVATLNIGYVCSTGINTEDDNANLMRVEAYARLLNNDTSTDGTVVKLNAAVNFNDQEIFIAQKELTVVDDFVDFVHANVSVTNDSVISLNSTVTTPIDMNIAEVKSIPILLNIPPYTSIKVQFDVDLPMSSTASITYKSLKVVSSGFNLAKYGYEEDYKITTLSTQNTTQINKVFVDMGIITNTGVSYRIGKETPEDDVIYMELEIQMADSDDNDHQAIKWISLGAKVATFIVISEYQCKVIRTGNEKPVFNLTAVYDAVNSTSTKVEVDIKLEHAETSTAEYQNTILKLNVPPYLTFSGILAVNPTTLNYTETPIGDNAVEFSIGRFFFTDSLEMTLSLEVNSTYKVPTGISTNAAVTGVECIANVIGRTLPSVLSDSVDHTSGFIPVNFTLLTSTDTGGSCTTQVINTVAACHLSSSGDDISGPENALTTEWVPPVRDGKLGELRYLQVYFGEKVILTTINYMHTKTDKVTEIILKYSDDGKSWLTDWTSIPLSAADGHFQATRSSKYVRFHVRSTSAPSKEVGLKFSFEGCFENAPPVTVPCPTAAPPAPAEFIRRSFVIDDTYVYVCDGSLGSKGHEIETQCYKSMDGSKWGRMDARIACMVGFDNNVKGARIYALTDDYVYMSSKDQGVTWMAISSQRMTNVKASPTFTAAVKVPWVNNADLQSAGPVVQFTQGGWRAKYEGLGPAATFVNKFKWDKCCPA